MSASDPQATQKINSCLKDIVKTVKSYDHVRLASESNLNAMGTLHKKIEQDDRIQGPQRNKLKQIYEDVIKDADKEEELLRKALDKIYQIRQIRSEMRIAARNAGNKETIRRGALMKMLATSAQTIPLWVGREGEDPPPLCGAIPAEANYVAQTGDMAAALVRSPDGDENWILAEVVTYNQTTGRYEVDDIDEEQKDRHALSRRKVIPLPTRRACPETNPEALYEPGVTVMAIYPQTTCFYKGVIKEQPSTGSDEYQVLFEDPSYADGYSPPLYVAQRYIITVTDKKKGK